MSLSHLQTFLSYFKGKLVPLLQVFPVLSFELEFLGLPLSPIGVSFVRYVCVGRLGVLYKT